MRLGPDGRLRGARFTASPNCDARPQGARVTLLVLHSISLPPGTYGGDAVERLFTNRLDAGDHPYFRELVHMRVSAHFFVRRDGALQQFVPLHRRAWHAGASHWRGRESAATTTPWASSWKVAKTARSPMHSTGAWRD
jgi:N-acetyl-anhydromuramoyl-L-alanine amidase